MHSRRIGKNTDPSIWKYSERNPYQTRDETRTATTNPTDMLGTLNVLRTHADTHQ
jgi:hypothetical protein